MEYICTVSDNYGHSQSVTFNLSVLNDITAQAVASNVSVPIGQTGVLEVNATSTADVELSYQWAEEVQRSYPGG